jgi:hypothetical protein
VKNGEGWEIPCQPRLNSSINFFIVVVTSRDQRIQNKAKRSGFPDFSVSGQGAASSPAADRPACLVPGGREYCVQAKSTGETIWDGWTARSR